MCGSSAEMLWKPHRCSSAWPPAAQGRVAYATSSSRPPTIAEMLLQAAPGDLPPLAGTTRSGMVVSDAPDESSDVVIRLLRLLDRPRDVRVLAPLIERRQFGVRPSQDAARLHGITRAEVPAVV
ncbi:hypothetical protein ADK66_04750 [Micromonospora sp. NRRL B-16802]|nr:hypothetical protein ADK66_04750 [Micromonospora sp. NRRL B-16802]